MDDDVVASLKWQAQQKGHSLQSDLKEFLIQKAREPKRALVDRLHKLCSEIEAESGELPDSSALIREERDKRW